MACCLILLLGALLPLTEAQQKKGPPPKISWLTKLGRILGIDVSPAGLKGPSLAASGEIWVVSPLELKPRRVTTVNNFTSPIFRPDGKYIYALQGEQLTQISPADGKVEAVRKVAGLIKLVGFDSESDDRILAVFSSDREKVDIAMIRLQTAEVEVIAKGQSQDQSDTEYLLGWTRHYGKVTVYSSGEDVYFEDAAGSALIVSDCGYGLRCTQPSYLSEPSTVVYIRSKSN